MVERNTPGSQGTPSADTPAPTQTLSSSSAGVAASGLNHTSRARTWLPRLKWLNAPSGVRRLPLHSARHDLDVAVECDAPRGDPRVHALAVLLHDGEQPWRLVGSHAFQARRSRFVAQRHHPRRVGDELVPQVTVPLVTLRPNRLLLVSASRCCGGQEEPPTVPVVYRSISVWCGTVASRIGLMRWLVWSGWRADEIGTSPGGPAREPRRAEHRPDARLPAVPSRRPRRVARSRRPVHFPLARRGFLVVGRRHPGTMQPTGRVCVVSTTCSLAFRRADTAARQVTRSQGSPCARLNHRCEGTRGSTYPHAECRSTDCGTCRIRERRIRS